MQRTFVGLGDGASLTGSFEILDDGFLKSGKEREERVEVVNQSSQSHPVQKAGWPVHEHPFATSRGKAKKGMRTERDLKRQPLIASMTFCSFFFPEI